MDEWNTVDLSKLFYVLVKRKSLIITITLVVTIICGIISFFILSPVYESKATVIVGKTNTNSNNQYDDVMMYQNLTKTYSEIALSNNIESKAAEKIGNGMTAEKLSRLITVSPETGTQIIDISAQGDSAKDALIEVTALANSFVANAKNIYTDGKITIMDKGELAKAPIKPNKKLNLVIAFILGLVASMGVSFLLEYMDNTLKTADDVKIYLDLPVLGTIALQDEV